MGLRGKLLLVALATLTLPWAAWQYLRETEQFLRAGEERALLAAADVLAQAAARHYAREPWPHGLYVRPMQRPPLLDGYLEQDWEPWQATTLGPAQLALGESETNLYLALSVDDAAVRYARGPVLGDHLLLSLVEDGQERRYLIAAEAPGPLWANPLDGRAGPPLRGEWQERAGGYSLELLLPRGDALTALGLVVVDVDAQGERRVFGTGTGDRPSAPLPLLRTLPASALAELAPAGGRVWLTDRRGWVLARAGALSPQQGIPEGRWLRSVLYRYLLASGLDEVYLRSAQALRLEGKELASALAGERASLWRPAQSESTVIASVAVPVRAEERIVGALIMEQSSDSLLLLTNRAFGSLLWSSGLALAAALAALLWFSSRLSWRIRRLRDAAERAVSPEGHGQEVLPLSADGDELGDLSRAFGRALADLRQYTDYLRSLADKLSHELRTPLAVVSSSLDNLAQERLPPAAEPYLQRARQGAARLSRILRAMSEAGRLEQSLQAEEGERFDLAALVRGSAGAYSELAGERALSCHIEPGEYSLYGSPELIGQLLDKLVDNALDFTPAEGWLRISLMRQGRELELRVANQGPPLPQSMRGRLFDSLVSVRQNDGGEAHLGLGLYVVRLIAELHGGRVACANLPNGVEFRVRLVGMPEARPVPEPA